MKKVLVLGAGGFIGSHLVKKLKEQGCWVRGVDLKYPEYETSVADDFDYGESVIVTKNKLRGSGKCLSLKIQSETGKDIKILGWGIVATALNQP